MDTEQLVEILRTIEGWRHAEADRYGCMHEDAEEAPDAERAAAAAREAQLLRDLRTMIQSQAE